MVPELFRNNRLQGVNAEPIGEPIGCHFSNKQRNTLNWFFEYKCLSKIIFGIEQFSQFKKAGKPLKTGVGTSVPRVFYSLKFIFRSEKYSNLKLFRILSGSGVPNFAIV